MGIGPCPSDRGMKKTHGRNDNVASVSWGLLLGSIEA